MIIVPPNFTKDLQVLDVLVNKEFKNKIRKEFVSWTTLKLIDEMKSAKIRLDNGVKLHTKEIKKLIPQWCKNALQEIPTEIIKKAWEKVDIENCWSNEIQELAENKKEELLEIEPSSSRNTVIAESFSN